MLHENLLNPISIAVIGASNNIETPGGKVLKNLLECNFKGDIFAVNPKETQVQGIKCYQNVSQIPDVDLAIIAISSKFTLETVAILTEQKSTKGFIIFSAGFSEKDESGKQLEEKIVQKINAVGGSLLGPNNIGLINQNYAGVFTTPIPKLNPKGVDFISGSGATAVFIIEAAMATGLSFSSVYSVGNSAQIGVEDVLQHLDETFIKGESSLVKLLYIESIENPQKLLKHSSSLIKKGCRIASIKAGSSKDGSRAASSHTGAIANSDSAVDALFKKAGIVRCYGRNELITVASVFMYKELVGKNIAIITHAGGPAVMLTDVLSKKGLQIPEIKSPESENLLAELFSGSSVTNPIDFLATGNAEQLETIIDYCEHKFDEIDAMVVIFGSPGLFNVKDVYAKLDEKIKTCKKPIFPVLPSAENAKDEIAYFKDLGNVVFFDEVQFGNALAKANDTKPIKIEKEKQQNLPTSEIRELIKNSENGYMSPELTHKLLKAAQIPLIPEVICKTKLECLFEANKFGFPIVMKVVGPIHKTDVNGVIINIKNKSQLINSFEKLMAIDDAIAVLLQPMKKGLELFVGAKKEGSFGHLVAFGLGGIYIEVFKDILTSLAPLSKSTSKAMLKNLKSYKIINGTRNQKGINKDAFAEIIAKISELVIIAPEIAELDLNPLFATEKEVFAVDARIRIEK